MKLIKSVLLLFLVSISLIGCNDDYDGNYNKVIFDTRGGNEIASIECSPSEQIDLPTPVREDAIFMGWYSDTDWKNRISSRPLIEKNTVLYARWAIFQTIQINTTNYSKYFDVSVKYYEYHEKNLYTFGVYCNKSNIVVQDGDSKKPFNTTSLRITVRNNTTLVGNLNSYIWRLEDGRSATFSNVSDYELQNGLIVTSVTGRLCAYILEDAEY